MPDKRAYFKLDVGYMTNPKVLEVIDESPTAVLLHVASIGYAAQHLTDGEIPVKALLRMTGATQADADLLVAAGLWIIGTDPTKADVHDFLQHQRSAAEVKGSSAAAKKAADVRWHGKGNVDDDADRNADGMRSAMADASESAMPREEREERERTTTKDVSEADATDAPKGLALVSDRPDVDRLCSLLADAVEANGSNRPAVTKGWRDAARLMVDKDGRAEADIIGAIRWCQADEFWRSNIMSMPKLRERYDRIRLEAQRKRTTSKQQQTDDLFARNAARLGITGGGL